MRMLPESLLEAIRTKGNLVLATHLNPDGDALGSLFGLADILESMGKRVFRYLEKPVSPLYSFIPGSESAETDLAALSAFVRRAGEDILCISLDCGDEQRLGKFGTELLKIRPFAVIDHHKGNSGFGDLAWIDAKRSSTGEMVFDLAAALGCTPSEKAAIALFTAIVTDTGSFRYESTSAHTFDVARQLVDLGVRPDTVSRNIYDNFSVARLRLMQMVLATLEVLNKDRIAVIRVTQEMLARTGCKLEDTENFINLPRAVTSVEVAVFLKESAADNIAVSLRAKDACDVAEIAARFGGGGHRNAAGFTAADMTLDEVWQAMLPVLHQELDR
ncbi:MAG: bifunctional oligoribonuclease/PAP phosphatase NrnA [Desulfobulbaceae bacterium]|nr:bifunctional oligoribonuclease/PAP phosphatase NrnA [Desulfobulbaceae bacterium]